MAHHSAAREQAVLMTRHRTQYRAYADYAFADGGDIITNIASRIACAVKAAC